MAEQKAETVVEEESQASQRSQKDWNLQQLQVCTKTMQKGIQEGRVRLCEFQNIRRTPK